jgi:Tfp pilus assembly protein FimT
MVIVGIIGFLVAISVPNFLDWNRKYKLKSAVAELHANIGMARMTAINQNTTVTVTVTQAAATDPVTVTFSGASGLSPLTLDSEISLTDANGASAGSPQDLRFNSKGLLQVNTANTNNLCINTTTGAGVTCASNTAQAVNFKNTQGLNYRIVVAPTGKVSWCYTNTCGQ